MRVQFIAVSQNAKNRPHPRIVGRPGSLAAGSRASHPNVAGAARLPASINLLTDNTAHADKLAELGIAPVVTVLARAYARRAACHRLKRRPDQWAETIGEWCDRTFSLPRRTPAGRRIAIWPATYSDATCKTCGACAGFGMP